MVKYQIVIWALVPMVITVICITVIWWSAYCLTGAEFYPCRYVEKLAPEEFRRVNMLIISTGPYFGRMARVSPPLIQYGLIPNGLLAPIMGIEGNVFLPGSKSLVADPTGCQERAFVGSQFRVVTTAPHFFKLFFCTFFFSFFCTFIFK